MEVKRREESAYLVLVGTEAKVLDGLTGVLGSSEEQGVASGRGSESQLVQGQDLSSSSLDAGPSSSSEAEGRNTELGNGQEAVVISDSPDDHNGLVVGLLGCVGDNARNGDRWSVDTGHKKAAEDDLVEGRLGPAWRKVYQC